MMFAMNGAHPHQCGLFRGRSPWPLPPPPPPRTQTLMNSGCPPRMNEILIPFDHLQMLKTLTLSVSRRRLALPLPSAPRHLLVSGCGMPPRMVVVRGTAAEAGALLAASPVARTITPIMSCGPAAACISLAATCVNVESGVAKTG